MRSRCQVRSRKVGRPAIRFTFRHLGRDWNALHRVLRVYKTAPAVLSSESPWARAVDTLGAWSVYATNNPEG